MIIEYYSNDKYKYSTALMFAYINICKPSLHKINIEDLKFNLDMECWKNNVKPIDVLNDMKNKKYKEEIKRIKYSDTKYPIIINSKYYIIDGYHRFMKHILENKKTIKVYMFDNKTMKKFIIAKHNEEFNLEINDFIELFNKRFIV